MTSKERWRPCKTTETGGTMQNARNGLNEPQTEQTRTRPGRQRTYPNSGARWLICAALGLGLGLALPAFAQSESPAGSPPANAAATAPARELLQEVVVTATRREEKLSNVPASIT